MSKKRDIQFGNLPRSGYIYQQYRGHVVRLGIVTALLLAIVCWAWSGSWVTVRSYLMPQGTIDLTPLVEQPMPEIGENPTPMAADRVSRTGVWMQDGCYRLEVTFDAVAAPVLTLEAAQVYEVTAQGYRFLAVTAPDAPAPVAAQVYKAVMTPVADEAVQKLEDLSYPGYWIDLRRVLVGSEAADTLQMLTLTPVVIVLIVFWLLLTLDPKRHPIYRQLGCYGMRVDMIVASIDGEMASGSILSESKKQIVTPNWVLRRSSFNTFITKNTNTAVAAEDKGIISDE